MLWIIFAFLSAACAGASAVLAKAGMGDVDSDAATAVRTIVVLIFSCIVALVAGAFAHLDALGAKKLIFLALSGVSTGLSWLCYYRAIQKSSVLQVAPIDKSSVLLTMTFAFVFLSEPISFFKLLGMALIAAGTYLALDWKRAKADHASRVWIAYAVASAVFAALTAILGKVGVTGVDSNLSTFLRTLVVLVFAWGVVFTRKKTDEVRRIRGARLAFTVLSGVATGASWLLYWYAMGHGQAAVVAPIDKLSIVFCAVFAAVFLREKMDKKTIACFALMTAGTLLQLIK